MTLRFAEAIDESEPIESFVEKVIRHITGFKGSLPETTELYYDLSIAGDDMIELMEAVSKRFGTSWEGIKFHEYFPDEFTALFYQVAKLLGFRKQRSFPIAHLMNVIHRGRWVEGECLRR